MSSSSQSKLHQEKVILLSLLAGIALIIGAVLYVNFLRQKASQTSLPANAPLSIVVGDKKADTKVVVYTDPLCEKCADFHRDTVLKIRKEYADSGKITLEIRPLSIISDQSANITELLMCSNEQGKYWEVADIAFTSIWSNNGKSHEENAAAIFDNYPVAKIAKMVNADETKLSDCIKDDRFATKISQADAQAYTANVYSTPTTFIGSHEPIRGAVNYQYIKSLIDISL